jgi:glutamate carboxypeptidase
MARQILAIEAMTDYARGLTLSVGVIAGGTTENTVPDHCRASLDVRMETAEDAAFIDGWLKGLVPVGEGTGVRVTGGLNRPPFEETPAIRALFDHAKGLAAEIGFELVGIRTGGGSDGNFTAARVATLDGLGADGAKAHTDQEHIFVSSLVPRMTLMRRLFETLA